MQVLNNQQYLVAKKGKNFENTFKCFCLCTENTENNKLIIR
jgi:hypothetical protein